MRGLNKEKQEGGHPGHFWLMPQILPSHRKSQAEPGHRIVLYEMSSAEKRMTHFLMHHLSEDKCGRVEKVTEVRPELKKNSALPLTTSV